MEARQIKIEEKKKRGTIYKLLGIMILLVVLLSTAIILIYNAPFFKQTKINLSDDIKIFYMGEELNDIAYKKENKLYIPYTFIKKHIDPEIVWDKENRYVIITTNDNVFHISLKNNQSLLNLEPYSFTYPIVEKDSNIFLPVDPICNYYNIELDYLTDKNIVRVHDLKKPILQGRVLGDTKLRKEPELNSNWYEKITNGKEVNILKEINGWYWVESNDGLMGYIDKNSVEITVIQTNTINDKTYQPWNPLGEKIVLTWEYANRYPAINTNKINNLSSVQVVSPTWFKLNANGIVKSIADIEYVNWAHKNKYHVWGLFSNSFDPAITHEMLSNVDLRIKVIKQILTYIDLYKLDGINIDFENVYLEDKDLLVQFMRELTPLLHEKDKTVSIDVTFKSLSKNWSLFLDRKRLGEIVDYVVVMAYDEHWASSPIAGSVSSIPWVENGIKKILKEVPNDKVILGVPLYTRLWTEKIDKEGKVSVSSQALKMDTVNEWIIKHNANIKYDEESGQNYVEVKADKITHKIWLEDSTSMKKRVEIMKKYRLAGIAAWRRGFESKDFWHVISDYLE